MMQVQRAITVVATAVRRWRRALPGQNLVEFAAASLILISLILGTMEFGWAFYVKNQIVNAAREGARWAAVHGNGCYTNAWNQTCSQPVTASSIQAQVQSYVQSKVVIPNPNSVQVTVSAPDGDPLDPGKHVQVQVQYSFTPLVGFAIRVPTISMQATSTMIVHY
jgi:Flp pilus assembly protein TadG